MRRDAYLAQHGHDLRSMVDRMVEELKGQRFRSEPHADRTAGLPLTGPSTTTSPHPLIADRGPRFPRPLGHGPGSIPDRSSSGSASGRGGSADPSAAWAGSAAAQDESVHAGSLEALR